MLLTLVASYLLIIHLILLFFNYFIVYALVQLSLL